ncbi:hypothetical protein E8E14_013565 [Neopestalotiopsis sp. 37M]|nr:hypothetical protein E8E14_013565 [Neopestalotiopsis sp. 37M]
MASTETPKRLCIYCRTLEPLAQPCPYLEGRSQSATDSIPDAHVQISGLTPQDAELIKTLQARPSALCTTCAKHDILHLLTESDPLDRVQRQMQRDEARRPRQPLLNFKFERVALGTPSTLVLNPSCQLCRMLYCIVPRKFGPKGDEPDLYLEPYRSHLRVAGWETVSEDLKKQCAVMLGITTSVTGSILIPDIGFARVPVMTGPSIALELESAAPDRQQSISKPIEVMLDGSKLRLALDSCSNKHGDTCRITKPESLLTTRMVDVNRRVVVPYSKFTDYVALSYVLGGIQASHEALENGHLPQTIEDAITVTKSLGLQYLWVDALCIDQFPKPTPEQLDAKMQQLNLMSVIYGCATMTLVAVTGKHADAGLCGISFPRLAQLKECIDGYSLFTTPALYTEELLQATYSSRAWTMQELILSPRKLLFAQDQAIFTCPYTEIEEGADYSNWPTSLPMQHPLQKKLMRLYGAEPAKDALDPVALQQRMPFYAGMVTRYTERSMTMESDSLNACRGMLSAFQKEMFPEGFENGLPLRSHTFSLAWMHSRNVNPKRRAQFPSWSWTGWEGQVIYPEIILDTADGQGPPNHGIDLLIELRDCRANQIELEGWVVDADIRTEPFSELFTHNQEESIGAVKEGAALHNNTLKSGLYHCLVIQRHCSIVPPRKSFKETVFMLAIQPEGGAYRRQGILTVTLFPNCSFDQIARSKRIIQLI